MLPVVVRYVYCIVGPIQSFIEELFLRLLYGLVVGLCLFMSFWIAVGPASWRIEWSGLPGRAFHRSLLEGHFAGSEQADNLGIAPRSLIFKGESIILRQMWPDCGIFPIIRPNRLRLPCRHEID